MKANSAIPIPLEVALELWDCAISRGDKSQLK